MTEPQKDPKIPERSEADEPEALAEGVDAPEAEHKLDDYVKMMMRLRGGGARPILCW